MTESVHPVKKWIEKYVKNVSLKPIHNDNPVKVADLDCAEQVFKPYEAKAEETKHVGA